MSDDEIKALRSRADIFCEFLAHHDALQKLADEALARGAKLVQMLENAEVLRLALKTDTEMFAECRERVAQLETALREALDITDDGSTAQAIGRLDAWRSNARAALAATSR